MNPRIGLEVHVYVATSSKLFCDCSAAFLDAPPMVNTCVVCTAQPGAKPLAPNRAALVAALRLARAAGMATVERARFMRKHYFYPDSPANYQRTSEPLATGGTLGGVRLTELHVEEDPGAFDPVEGLVDDNRAGAPLIEFVTEPDMGSPEEARAFLRELRLTLDYLGIANRAAGVKADCNVSLDRDDGQWGPRVEIKNVNGFKNVERAIEAEVARQLALVKEGGAVEMETRGFDEATGRSVRTRSKESVADYRYMVDPDVPPLDIASLANEVPKEESPSARRKRLAEVTGASEEEVEPLLEEPALADALEALVSAGIRAADAHRFLLRDVRGDLEYAGLSFVESPLDVKTLSVLLAARIDGRLTPHQTTRLLRVAIAGEDFAKAFAEETGAQSGDVDAEARAVVTENPKAVADFRAGKQQAVNFLVGQLMKRTRGRADVTAAREAILRVLE